MTRDPKGGINQYSYCRNNPLRYVDPDGCENKDWIDDDKDYTPGWVYKRHSHVHYWCGVWVEDDPIYWLYHWAIVGIVLAGCAIVAVGIALAPYISALANAMVAAGSKVASAVMSGLKAAWSTLSGMSVQKITLILKKLKAAIIYAAAFLKGVEIVFNCDIDFGLLKWGFILTIFDKSDKSEWGWVTMFGEQDYQWKSELVSDERIYYVKIGDQLVQMPDDWLPGNPIPEEYLP